MSSLPLFSEPTNVDQPKLAARLKSLAEQGIYFGTSSWKYEGWLGSIYQRERYLVRGKFSKKRFEATCLDEYAATFPIVCGDFSFYNFPSEEFWRGLFQGSPKSLRFALKVPEEITVKTFPQHARYGARAGLDNPSFLNADLFDAAFLSLLLPYANRLTTLIIEFGAFPKRAYERAEEFVTDLDQFLSKLPLEFRYAVEIRNADFLTPEYLDCLRRHRVAHVFNAWTRMPELSVQLRIPDIFTTDFVVARALLRHGRAYEDAVKAFSPYEKVQDPNPGARDALKELLRRSEETREPAYLFVNNRLEGNAPETIQAVVTAD